MNQKEEQRYQNVLNSGAPLTAKQASRYMEISTSLLEKMRKDGSGPKFRWVRMGSSTKTKSDSGIRDPTTMPGGSIRYDRGDVDRFMPGGASQNYTTSQAANLLQKSTRTLEEWRRLGVGPPWVTYGKKLLRYPLSGLQAYLASLERGAAQSSSRIERCN